MHNSKIILIGLGNEFRGDDGVGLFIIRKLKDIVPPHIVTIEVKDHPTLLIEIWKNFNRVIIFDAVYSSNKPGTIYQFNPVIESFPSQNVHSSTHSMSLIEVIELSRTLHQLPPYMTIIGVEGKSYKTGQGLSGEVANAVDKVVDMVNQNILDNCLFKNVSPNLSYS